MIWNLNEQKTGKKKQKSIDQNHKSDKNGLYSGFAIQKYAHFLNLVLVLLILFFQTSLVA